MKRGFAAANVPDPTFSSLGSIPLTADLDSIENAPTTVHLNEHTEDLSASSSSTEYSPFSDGSIEIIIEASPKCISPEGIITLPAYQYSSYNNCYEIPCSDEMLNVP